MHLIVDVERPDNVEWNRDVHYLRVNPTSDESNKTEYLNRCNSDSASVSNKQPKSVLAEMKAFGKFFNFFLFAISEL